MGSSIVTNLLSENPDTSFVFDIDGVLSSYEYGVYNHGLPEEDWHQLVQIEDPYLNERPFEVMQDFIMMHLENCYVCSCVGTDNEIIYKQDFIRRHYGIPLENQYYVRHREDKLNVLKHIHKKLYPEDYLYFNENQKYIAMIEDTVDTLNFILEHSKFSTIHVSSFFI